MPIIDAFRLALLNPQFNEIYCTVKKEANEESRGRETLRQLNALLVCSFLRFLTLAAGIAATRKGRLLPVAGAVACNGVKEILCEK